MHTEIKVQLINQEKLESTSRETAGCDTQQREKCHKWQRAQGRLAGCHEQVKGSLVEDHHDWQDSSVQNPNPWGTELARPVVARALYWSYCVRLMASR